MAGLCREKGVRHREIVYEWPALFRHDGIHLSTLGNKSYLDTLTGTLEDWVTDCKEAEGGPK